MFKYFIFCLNNSYCVWHLGGGHQTHPFPSDGQLGENYSRPSQLGVSQLCSTGANSIYAIYNIYYTRYTIYTIRDIQTSTQTKYTACVPIACTAVCFLCAELACGREEAGTGEAWRSTLRFAHKYKGKLKMIHKFKCTLRFV